MKETKLLKNFKNFSGSKKHLLTKQFQILKIITVVFLFETFVFVKIPKAQAADITPPITTSTQTPATPDGKNGWYVTPVQFTLTATDLESGVKEINYQVDGGAWQTANFSNTLNLVQNPSFETPGSTETQVDKWDATQSDSAGSYSQDTTTYAPGYSTASLSINAPGGNWNAANNKNYFAVASPYQNMSATAWVKTQDVGGQASFKIYAVEQNQQGQPTLLAQSSSLTGTNNWTKLSVSFVVSDANAIGVYIDVGFSGSGTMWVDAVTINSAAAPAATSLTVGSDSATHTLAFYSVDNVGNTETYSCTSPIKNCVNFKIDQTVPGNWHGSGAVRGIGSDHELYVYTNVDDATSGLSTLTNKYEYYTDNNTTFGRYENLLHCNTQWQPNTWPPLLLGVTQNGADTEYLKTQKTDFCNSDWKVCKETRFYAEDVAGNNDTKDMCINGPWIQVSGKAYVRSNNNINMIAESQTNNTDGLIEIQGNSISFFSSSKNWKVTAISAPENFDYAKLYPITTSKTAITNGKLPTTTGVYLVNGNFTVTNTTIPTGYSGQTFNQIIFINGDLTFSTDLSTSANSTLLFIVKGKTQIAKTVNTLKAAVFSDGDMYTAYNVSEGEAVNTLTLNGLYGANKIWLQRTLQGTNNSKTPSEIFNYEPKYVIQLKSLFGTYNVTWLSTE